MRKRLPVAQAEPTAAQLEELIPQMVPPVQVDLPAQFHSALLSSSAPPGPGPTSAPPPRGAIPWLPPLPAGGGGGACETPEEEKREQKAGIHDDESKETHCPTKPPAPVPEPGSILLVSSGLAVIVAAYRKRATH
jgi:hypothetical protein